MLLNSESSEETSSLLTDKEKIRDKLMEEPDSVLNAIDNLAKYTESKFKILEAKVDMMQTNVSFMHSRSMQETFPTGKLQGVQQHVYTL